MLLKSVKFRNFLSFGGTTEEIPLQNLNVIIGPNASGKSNFIRIIGVLQNANRAINMVSEFSKWKWKGAEEDSAIEISVVLNTKGASLPADKILKHDLRYMLKIYNNGSIEEKIEAEGIFKNKTKCPIYFHCRKGEVIFNKDVPGRKKRIVNEKYLNSNQSILPQFRDPEQLPEANVFFEKFEEAQIYNHWGFGADEWARSDSLLGEKDDVLDIKARNLVSVLKRLKENKKAKDKLLKNIQDIYSGVKDIQFKNTNGIISLVIEEENDEKVYDIETIQLSDGTMRYLSLLAILCDPAPPRLICIEEPELGMHPDIIPIIADLFIDASKRCQIIVTTHSEIFLDAFSETRELVESVLVVENDGRGTCFTRLEYDELKDSLEEGRRLSNLWSSGELGGNRW